MGRIDWNLSLVGHKAFSSRMALVLALVAGAGCLPGAEGLPLEAAEEDVVVKQAAATVTTRGYVATRFALELDGAVVGFVQGVEGGNASADVVVERLGAGEVPRKHLAGVKYDDLAFEVGPDLGAPLWRWIQETLGRTPTRKSGSIISVSTDGKEVRRLEFSDALISEIGFPAADGASKEAAFIGLKLRPQATRLLRKGSGRNVALPSTAKASRWIASNFQLNIDGTDAKRVTAVGPLVIKTATVESPVGEQRDYGNPLAASVEMSNLVVTLAENAADAWYDWHEDFVIAGNNGQGAERNGTLTYLSPDLRTPLFTIELGHLGIFRLATEASGTADALPRLTAEMYVEELRLTRND